ncbi:phosphatase 2C-like domain-containing protein [Gautieria morchelliformis]|nr:phosphatase 2C-like domain-containing protein [Gautieria morchelliformis]
MDAEAEVQPPLSAVNATSAPEVGHNATTNLLKQNTEPSTPPSKTSEMSSTRFSDSPNARSKTVTTAAGPDTYGALNQHPSVSISYSIGVSEDKGQRRTMEDAYAFVADFANVRGQGYFAIFDGHAGKHAAEWCGQHFHEYLLNALRGPPSTIPDVLNQTFHSVDSYLSQLAADGQTHSGCTAVTAFLRIEDAQGGQDFFPEVVDSPVHSQDVSANGSPGDSDGESPTSSRSGRQKKSGSRIRSVVQQLSEPFRSASPSSRSSLRNSTSFPPEVLEIPGSQQSQLRRVLYTANVGDARAVLSRAGKAVRLTYDHKGSDKQEAKRIMDAGGFVMNNRVNGVLAVTRSLGDSSMKEFVVGSPYTTETELSDEDEFLVIACDGLWDVAEDQKVVDLVRHIQDPQEASSVLLKFAMDNHTSDNVTVLVVRFKTK